MSEITEILPPDFDDRFLSDYLGSVIKDPTIAIIEMIANSWDAGAENVSVHWPDAQDEGGIIEIRDDGKGMTDEEFSVIWPTASYNRSKTQNNTVILSDGTSRTVFGHNGVGRFGMFCFSQTYTVETWKDGEYNKYAVSVGKPYTITRLGKGSGSGRGTTITCSKKGITNFLSEDDLVNLIRSRFFDGRLFRVEVNGREVDLSRGKPIKEPVLMSASFGDITLTRYSCDKKNKGLLFRVNNRAVGQPSWDFLEAVDSRRSEFKFQLVVDVDPLKEDLLPDWSGFKNSSFIEKAMAELKRLITDSLDDILASMRYRNKEAALRSNVDRIRELPNNSKVRLGRILDEMQQIDSKMTVKDCENIIIAIAKCEMSESKYQLMEAISKADPTEIDSLNSILKDWSIREMKIVYDELNERMKVVQKLKKLVNDKETDELHVLQPIFKDNLWMFGPEYDSCSFYSNRTLTTIIRSVFKLEEPPEDRRRPDIVMLPNSSICAYSADRFDSDGESDGLQKIVILELKRGGFRIGLDEKSQATKYAVEIRNSGKVNSDVSIMCYVLGSTVDPKCSEDSKEGENIIIRPLTYDGLLRKAELRLFDLMRKMEETNPDVKYSGDRDIDKVLKSEPDLDNFNSKRSNRIAEVNMWARDCSKSVVTMGLGRRMKPPKEVQPRNSKGQSVRSSSKVKRTRKYTKEGKRHGQIQDKAHEERQILLQPGGWKRRSHRDVRGLRVDCKREGGHRERPEELRRPRRGSDRRGI